ncbi:hypothetical protein [Rickettsia endosymbiont of Halotydeus destructor]|uniref:hypothetical protein n=1 Tax=Rickettsia endosymbiont of Halotydeus destructor TaxID=2996754 RepID=UPI003BB050A3
MFNQINILNLLLVSIFIFFIAIGVVKLWRYEKILKEKNLRIIQFYLDKKFLLNHLVKNIEHFSPQKYAEEFLKNIKFYFNLEDIRIISQEELQKDKELSVLFKKELEDIILLSKKEITTLYHILSKESDSSNRLYIHLLSNKNQLNKKNLIYVKAPYIFNKDEKETLDIYIHLAKIFFEQTPFT